MPTKRLHRGMRIALLFALCVLGLDFWLTHLAFTCLPYDHYTCGFSDWGWHKYLVMMAIMTPIAAIIPLALWLLVLIIGAPMWLPLLWLRSKPGFPG